MKYASFVFCCAILSACSTANLISAAVSAASSVDSSTIRDPASDSDPSAGVVENKCDYTKIKGSEQGLSEADLLMRALKEECPELMGIVLSKEKASDLFKGTKGYADQAMEYIPNLVKEMKGKTESDPETKSFQTRLKSIVALDDFLKQKCPAQEDTDACKAKDSFDSFRKKLSKFFESALAAENAEQEANRKKVLSNDPERKYRMKFCKNISLFAVLYGVSSPPIESNCIYLLHGEKGRLFAIQSAQGGILVAQYNHLLNDKIIFISTKKQYADNDPLQEMYVRSTGLKKYSSLTGVRTVNSFQYLGDADPENEPEEP
jgi:hypothetical protein